MPYVSVALGPDLSGRLAFVRLFDRDPTDPEALAWNDVTQAWQVAGSIYSQEAILLTETPPGSGTYELAADPGSGSLDTHYQVSVAPVGAVAADPSDPVVWADEVPEPPPAGPADAAWAYAPAPAGGLLRQVGRGLRGQRFQATLSGPLAGSLAFHLGRPARLTRTVPLAGDGSAALALAAADTAALPAGTHPWELWHEADPRPVAAGWLTVGEPVRPVVP